jgi:3-phosphoshikimate 1-carboxyvinyltransferase
VKYVEIKPSRLMGKIQIPPSKSLCHRAIICAALANGESIIENIIFSDDIIATIEAMKKLGAEIDKVGENQVSVKGGFPQFKPGEIIDCKESGSTLRFLIPISLLYNEKISFTGRGKLVGRPLDTYYRIFKEQGIRYTNKNGKLPLEVEGKFKPGDYKVEGNISSQFITGLMFTLPFLEGDSRIIITTDLESKGYVDLTLDVLNKFGIKIENKGYKEFYIRGNQKFIKNNYRVEGDYSQAAFWLVGGILGEEIHSEGLNPSSLQGDKAIVELIKEMNGSLKIDGSTIVTRSSNTRAISIDGSQCPDIIPIITVLAAVSEGETRIVNASRLRIKESDRLKAISTELNKLGANIKELEDGLMINGVDSLDGGTVDSWNDHRIAMSLAIASIRCKNDVKILNSDAVKKSYPNFWEDFKSLGGKVNEFNMGEKN